MAVNKVIYGGNTLVDLTGDTVTAADLADGVKATGADGNPIVGLMKKVTIDGSLSDTSTNPVQNKVIKEALDGKLGKNETAARATQDGAGNVITETYAKKADISGVVKSVNGTKPDTDGNVVIEVSGGGGVTVDEVLNATSLNPVANKTVYAALQEKVTAEEIADAYLPLTGGTVTGGITAPNFQTGAGGTNYFQCRKFRGEGDANSYYHAIDFGHGGHNVVDFYEYGANWNFYKCQSGKQSDAVLVGNINGNGWNGGARLTGAPTAPTAAVGTNTTQIATTAFVQNSLGSYVKTVNNTAPDKNGNVTIEVSGGVSTSESNTWTAQQNFHDLMLSRERYTTASVNGTSSIPTASTLLCTATGAFTLNLATLAGALSAGQSSIFTAYFAANADYTLTITNAGTIKYIGSASDVAITKAGLLLNIMMMKDNSGKLTSIVQASKLS